MVAGVVVVVEVAVEAVFGWRPLQLPPPVDPHMVCIQWTAA
jgi:hypothetical protein